MPIALKLMNQFALLFTDFNAVLS